MNKINVARQGFDGICEVVLVEVIQTRLSGIRFCVEFRTQEGQALTWLAPLSESKDAQDRQTLLQIRQWAQACLRKTLTGPELETLLNETVQESKKHFVGCKLRVVVEKRPRKRRRDTLNAAAFRFEPVAALVFH